MRNRLKEILEQKGHNQKWLADQLGLKPGTVGTWARNKNEMGMSHLFKTAVILRVDMVELLDIGEEDRVAYNKALQSN